MVSAPALRMAPAATGDVAREGRAENRRVGGRRRAAQIKAAAILRAIARKRRVGQAQIAPQMINRAAHAGAICAIGAVASERAADDIERALVVDRAAVSVGGVARERAVCDSQRATIIDGAAAGKSASAMAGQRATVDGERAIVKNGAALALEAVDEREPGKRQIGASLDAKNAALLISIENHARATIPLRIARRGAGNRQFAGDSGQSIAANVDGSVHAKDDGIGARLSIGFCDGALQRAVVGRRRASTRSRRVREAVNSKCGGVRGRCA